MSYPVKFAKKIVIISRSEVYGLVVWNKLLYC